MCFVSMEVLKQTFWEGTSVNFMITIDKPKTIAIEEPKQSL